LHEWVFGGLWHDWGVSVWRDLYLGAAILILINFQIISDQGPSHGNGEKDISHILRNTHEYSCWHPNRDI
jgi:hypothetical protein|tara:strand:- start:5954 stop:6163 length:210 start_codon:yes stop_codon:yes gene_type:complete